ncbi:MAG: Carboxyl-terminal protease [Candidatus Shapirobacteria bacterium GW2011_GWE2_38_30]|uniref:Carboxyl-terminal protease n=1 Tax=Candidatus Shapirobacteria bacterium GW2011_GWE2_38_30 TaxID=1618490 RepID=A0A0G0M3U9_9BACT|nr:MAG: Carboxyl-terminal protease [Candidatus Shapirobacteria bacterium GW2011_GWE2_38_30]
MKRIRNIVLVITLLVFVAAGSYRLGFNKATFGVSSVKQNDELNLNLMWQVKERLSETFLEKDKMNDSEMVYGAIEGMVRSLGDPYTVFLPPEENKSSEEDLKGEFGGVGISLGYKDETLAVMTPLPKTPADKAGLKAGDLILKITDKEKGIDEDTNGISLDEAVKMIRGKVGTEVTLKIYREGKAETFDVNLKRDNIVVASIEMEWKEFEGKNIAWVKLYKFSDRLYTEWPQMVKEIQSKKDDDFGGIVLDLRNNPGGFLQASVLVASDFLKNGVVVKQESSDGSVEVYEVDKSRGNLLNEKLVVLINGGSASASEILAGALKDYKRAKLVGEKSFGKGTVQQPEDFPDGSGLHVTIAKWLLPNGNNIHEVGVKPDVEVILDFGELKEGEEPVDNQLDKAMEVLLEE